jgi:DNA-binding transcriptional regulator YiaG
MQHVCEFTCYHLATVCREGAAMHEQVRNLARIRRMQQTGEAKQLREQAGVSLRTMARAVGVRASTLIRWEAGRVQPREPTALAWLAALDSIRAELEQDGPREAGGR